MLEDLRDTRDGAVDCELLALLLGREEEGDLAWPGDGRAVDNAPGGGLEAGSSLGHAWGSEADRDLGDRVPILVGEGRGSATEEGVVLDEVG